MIYLRNNVLKDLSSEFCIISVSLLVVVTVVANVVVVVVVIAARFLLSLPMEVQFGKLSE